MNGPRLVVGSDGTQLAMIQDGRVTVVETTTMSARAEIGLVGDDSDVALVGVPPKLVAISRLPSETRIFVVDPAGPEKLGDAVARPGMRLGAVGGEMMLLVGATNLVFDTRWVERAPSTLPVRGQVTAAGSMGDTRIVMVVGGALEEWDLSTRSPARRLRLDRPLDVLAIGGSEQRIWMVQRTSASRIEVINLQSRSTRVIEMPEPIERLHAHPFIDVLVAIGVSKTGYVVRVDRPNVPPAKLNRGALHDCVWVGTHLVVWPVDHYPEVIPSPVDLRVSPVEDEAVDDSESGAPTLGAQIEPVTQAPEQARVVTPTSTSESTLTQPSFSERLATWKARLEESRQQVAPSAPSAPAPPVPEREEATATILDRRAAGGWRGEIATWARAIVGRSHRPMPYLDPGVIDELMVRFGIEPTARPAIALLYGAYLVGAGGVARFDLASVIEWDWEQLSHKRLARSGILRDVGDRLELVREAASALDEAPPRCGTLVGNGVGDPGSSALVAPVGVEPQQLATWAAQFANAPLFVATARGLAKPARFVLEARIRGAMPVVTDEAIATEHGLVVAGRWPNLGVA